MQTRGLNAMSYADISARSGITKASLHYHFPAKADLGVGSHRSLRRAVLRRARRAWSARAPMPRTGCAPTSTSTAPCSRGADVPVRHARVRLRDAVRRRCRSGVSDFFERNYAWLERVIDQGVADGRLPATDSSHAAAQSLVAGLEGAMLVSRPTAGTRQFDGDRRRDARVAGGSGVRADLILPGRRRAAVRYCLGGGHRDGAHRRRRRHASRCAPKGAVERRAGAVRDRRLRRHAGAAGGDHR